MRKFGRFVPFVLLLLVLFATPGDAQQPQGFGTFLLGREEAPGPGDPDGVGFATLIIDASRGVLCYEIRVRGIAPATSAHIHLGGAGSPGPVVVPLTPPNSEGFVRTCMRVDPAVLRAILADPEAYYVNVHNAEYPAGALRGQLGD